MNKTSSVVTGIALGAFCFASATIYAQDMASPPNSLVVDENGRVGVGTATPANQLEVQGSTNAALVKANNTATTVALRSVFTVSNFGPPSFAFVDTSTSPGWDWLFRSSASGAFSLAAFGVATPPTAMSLTPFGNMVINGTLTQGSSRSSKYNVTKLDSRNVLASVLTLPIHEWSYKTDEAGVRHVGPMAEDFYEAFGLGSNNEGLSTLDASGVALAAIQGLHQVVVQKDERITQLENELAKLKAQQARLLAMERVLASLVSQSGTTTLREVDGSLGTMSLLRAIQK